MNSNGESWKVMVVDDEQDVFEVSKMCLQDITYDNKPIDLIQALSAKEARELYLENKDTALILLDVVMEETDAGLKFIEWIRKQQNNHFVKIIIRTGYPGYAPENQVIYDYEINEYQEKTDFTQQRIQTSVITALRAYKNLLLIENHNKEMEKLLKATQRLVPIPLIELLGKKDVTELSTKDHVECNLTVLFLDIRSFGKIAESMTPMQCYDYLSEIFDKIQPEIYKHSGFIDKFIGDALMAIFPVNADSAVQAAININNIIKKYNEEHPNQIYSQLRTGIGINTGNTIVGAIGRSSRLECTVIGDSVNIAFRMESTTKETHSGIIISEYTYVNLKEPDLFRFRELGYVAVKNKIEPVKMYEVLDCDPEEMIKLKLETLPLFQEGIQAYYDTNFEKAVSNFKEIISLNPSDFIAEKYLKLAEECLEYGVPDSWSGTLKF